MDNAIASCKAAHERLFQTVSQLDDDTVRRPSRLPDWTVGHVLTHLARNADGHALRLEAALRGEELARYPGGSDQRNSEIESGASRSAQELMADVFESARQLEATWQRSEEAGWPYSHLLATDSWPTSDSPLRRIREVEVHHADLGVGFECTDWSEEYVQWELEQSLKNLPQRLINPEDSRKFLAWVIGRAESPDNVRLDEWR